MRPVLPLAAALLLCIHSAAPAGAATWQADEQVLPSLGLGVSLGTSFPVDVDAEGRIYVAFQSGTPNLGYEIAYTRRDTDGQWSAPLLVSTPGRSCRNPSLDVDEDGGVHIVWEDLGENLDAGDSDIAYRTSDPEGVWGPVISLSPSAGASERPVVRADAFHRVHVSWVDARAGQFREILHALRGSDGAWAQPTVLSVGGVQPQEPYLAVDGLGVVHAVWADRGATFESRQSYDIVYSRIEPQAAAGTPPQRIVDHVNSALQPQLAAAVDGTLYLVWSDDRATAPDHRSEIFFKRFLPGIGWGHDKRYTRDEVGTGRPVVAVGSSSTVDIAWEDYRNGNPEVYYRQINEATGWDRTATRLTSDLTPSQTPALVALPGNRLAMLWTDGTGGGSFRVYVKEGSAVAAP